MADAVDAQISNRSFVATGSMELDASLYPLHVAAQSGDEATLIEVTWFFDDNIFWFLAYIWLFLFLCTILLCIAFVESLCSTARFTHYL